MKKVKLKLLRVAGYTLLEVLTIVSVLALLAFTLPFKNKGNPNAITVAGKQVRPTHASPTEVVAPATKPEQILMTAWNTAVENGTAVYDSNYDVTHIRGRVVTGSFGLEANQIELLKTAHADHFSNLFIDSVTGKLMVIKPTATTVMPGPTKGPNGETPGIDKS
jgi:hypothetical protein